MKTRQEYETIKGLSTEDINAKMSSGEIEVPEKGPERDAFLNFAMLPADSAERNAFLDDLESGGSPAGDSAEDKQEPTPADGDGGTTEDAGDGEGASSSDPKWKQLGYESEEAMYAAVETLKNDVITGQQALDRFNAERGKIGQKVKDAEKRAAEREAEAEELRKKLKENAPAPKTRPAIPELPSPDEFDDGVADDKYTDAMADYRRSVSQYQEDLAAYDASITSRLDSLQEVVSEIKPKVDRASSYVEDTSLSAAANATSAAWEGMWNSTKLDKFVKDYQLNTTIPAQQISNAWATINAAKDAEPANRPDPGSLAVAQRTVNALTEADKANYGKVKLAIESFYDFSEGIPKEKHYRTFVGCINDLGLSDQFRYEREVEPNQDEQRLHDEEKLRKETETATGLPAGKEDSDSLEQPKTPDEEKAEYAALTTEYSQVVDSGEANASAWEATDKFKRLKALRLKFTGRLPQFHKSPRYP